MSTELDERVAKFRGVGFHRRMDYLKYNRSSIAEHFNEIEGVALEKPLEYYTVDEGAHFRPEESLDDNTEFNMKAAFDKAMFFARYRADITVTRLRRLATLLMPSSGGRFKTGPEDEDDEKDKSRMINVRRGGGQANSYFNYRKVPRRLELLTNSLNLQRRATESMTPTQIYEFSFDTYYNFLTLSPWHYGNGIMARLIMNWIQIENNLVPSRLYIEDAAALREAVRRTRDEENAQILRDFMLASITTQIETDIETYKHVRREHPPYYRPHYRPRTALKILACLRENPFHTTKTLAKEIGITPKGIEKQLAKIRKRGEIKRIGPAHGGHWEVLVPEEPID